MIRIGLTHGYRTSGGGKNVNGGLLGGLEAAKGCTVVPFDPAGTLPNDCDVLVCTGSKAVRARGTKTVFWPLNVAPLEEETRALAATSMKARLRYRLLPLKLWASIARSDGLVFGSQYASDLYRSSFARARRLPTTVIRTGMPSLPLTEQPPRDPVRGRILMVSHLYPYKLAVEAIEAVAKVREQFPDAHLRIAGKIADPEYGGRVMTAVADYPGAAALIGSLSQQDLLAEYAAADVALLTSASENAASFHLFDAAAFGIPIVASAVSSTPSVMGEAARYVNPRHPDDIARGLMAVLGDEAERARMSHAAKAFGEAAPTWPERAQELITFCEGICR